MRIVRRINRKDPARSGAGAALTFTQEVYTRLVTDWLVV